MEPRPPQGGYDPRKTPAWPLGCAVAFFGLGLVVNVLGLGGIIFASAGLPPLIERGGTFALALCVPALMLVGWLFARRRNPYGARVILWGLGLTLALGALITLVFNLVDRIVLG